MVAFEEVEGFTLEFLMGPPNNPIVALDMDEDEEQRKQIGLLMAQILSPFRDLQSVWEVV